MRESLRAALAILLAGVVLQRPVQHARAAAPLCAARVAVLGANMSAGGRFEVQRALAVGPHTLQLNETLADEQSMAHGLFPPDLLGGFAVSSALLRPLPAGSGLTVTLNQGIRLETAQSYANALLTAGVTDADVGVAAPTSQQTLGATALLGLLRAASSACLAINPARRDLALREIVLTSELAQQIGRQAAPSLLFTLKSAAVPRKLTAPAALESLITHDAAAQGVVVPAANRAALVTFLRDLVASDTYNGVAAARPAVASAGLARVTVRLATTLPGSTRTASPTVGPSTWRGTIAAIGSRGVTLRLPNGIRAFTFAPAAVIFHDGHPGAPGTLRVGETVTATTDAAGTVTRVDAASLPAASSAAPPQAAPAAPATQSASLNAPAIAVLALLILLALVLLPLLVGYLRSRQPVVAGTIVQVRSSIFTPKGRAPLRKRTTPASQEVGGDLSDDE